MREYEAVFIVDPACDEPQVNQEVDTVKEVITTGNGEVVEAQVWGKRRLAYEIRRKKEGTYAFVRFRAASAVIAELNRRFKLNELVLRHLIVASEGIEESEQLSGPGESDDESYQAGDSSES